MPDLCLTRARDPFSWTVILLGTIMQQSNTSRFFLVVVLLLGLFQLVGCAAFRRPPAEVPVERLTVQEALQQAQEAYEDGAYERARELYDAVVASPEGLPEEEIRAARDRIVVIDSIFGQRTLVAKRERMAGLLAEAQALVSEERYEEAEAKLASLGVPEELSEDQEADLLNLLVTVERATGRVPGMTEEEVEDRAYRYLEQGMEAYHAKDYATAEGLFKRASALEGHLDYWGRSTLRKSRAEVTATLAELRAAYNEGKRAYRQDDYAGAVEYLQKVVDSGISIGAEQDQDVAWLLGDSKVLVAEQQRREEQWRRERLAALLVEAKALLSEGRYEEAEAMLAELASASEDLTAKQRRELQELRVAATLGRERKERERLAGLLVEAKALMAEERYEEAEAIVLKAMGVAHALSKEQQRELQELRLAVERATGRLPGMTAKEARELAYAYLERGMKAYHSNDYLAAEHLLGRAVALEEHLDRWGRRSLHSRHAEVTGRLTE
ncbi:MAG: coiled-coil domain-containing protein, partial [Planctomycetota bacterium]